MEPILSPSASKGRRSSSQLIDDESQGIIRRQASKINYTESEDGDEIVLATSGVRQGQETDEEIRCVCGENEQNYEKAFIGCDGCNVWQHNLCVGISEDEDEVPDRFFCEECVAAGKDKEVETPIREKVMATPVKKTLRDVVNAANQSQSASARKNKRVAFSSDVKLPSSSDDEDGYAPSNDSEAEEDEDDYAGDAEDGADQDSTKLTPTAVSHPITNGSSKPSVPRGTTELGQNIISAWLAGEYAADLAATNDDDCDSEVTEIEIPDMSAGGNLLTTLAEQEKLIFSLKGKLVKRGNMIVRLKQRVKGLEEENEDLKKDRPKKKLLGGELAVEMDDIADDA